ncbi:TPM domain-containing protein [Leptothoe sp. ISB3NOV94-8A]|nr:TPM domain-containing protein [Leptothoe sp. LEGE 181152]
MLSRPNMPVHWMRRGVIVTVVAIATILFSHLSVLPSWAQTGYPTASDPYLNDYAQLMRPEDAISIRQSLANLEANHGIEATVVTLNSIQDYGTGDSTIESFATNLFNTWGIGDAEKNNGILTLVAVNDRKVRIEVGSGYGTSLDSAMKSVIDEYMVPRFKQDDYSGGILQGTEAIIRRVTQPEETTTTSSPAAASRSSSPVVSRDTAPSYDGHGNHKNWLVGGGLTGLGGVGLIMRQFLRYRRRRCPDCGADMVRLDENSDNQYLDQGQNVEEQLGSVDYDVWQCPSCQSHNINRYGSLLSQYKTCRGCHYKTLLSRRDIIRPATYSSSGTARVTETCQHCSYENTYTVTIPRKQKSSSSSSFGGGSSSGGGGGRSSGGGASGSW